MSQVNRRIVLASRPKGEPVPENFRLEEGPMPVPGEGEVLLKTQWLSLDPYMRGRMSDAPSYAAPTAIGAVMPGATVCEAMGTGQMVAAVSGWQEYAVAPAKALRPIDTSLAPAAAWLGVLGMPGLTGYGGLLSIGQPKSGETVVVAAASGPVGGAVGQIAKIKGCRAVGIAGGPEKCRYVLDELGFDACIDHRASDFAEQLRRACPAGIDIYFENVGGKVLEAVVPLLNNFGRIPLCGLVAWYNLDRLAAGPDRSPALLLAILTKRLLVRGFIVTDFMSQFVDFQRDMPAWVASGRVKHREHVVEGLANAPNALIGLLKGENFGKVVVRVN
jgi:NADPH-dependent curcumin reductase CurA